MDAPGERKSGNLERERVSVLLRNQKDDAEILMKEPNQQQLETPESLDTEVSTHSTRMSTHGEDMSTNRIGVLTDTNLRSNKLKMESLSIKRTTSKNC